jgi:hypothetical protein
MADSAVVAGGVAGFCRMLQTLWNSPHASAVVFCEASGQVSPPIPPHLLDPSETRMELA